MGRKPRKTYSGEFYFKMMINKMKIVMIFLTIIILWSTACEFDRNRIYIDSNIVKMKKNIIEVIPIGSTIGEARSIMEDNEFECRFEKNGSFTEGDDKQEYREIKGINYLYCEREEEIAILQTRVYRVAFIYKDHKIADTAISTGLYGL